MPFNAPEGTATRSARPFEPRPPKPGLPCKQLRCLTLKVAMSVSPNAPRTTAVQKCTRRRHWTAPECRAMVVSERRTERQRTEAAQTLDAGDFAADVLG